MKLPSHLPRKVVEHLGAALSQEINNRTQTDTCWFHIDHRGRSMLTFEAGPAKAMPHRHAIHQLYKRLELLRSYDSPKREVQVGDRVTLNKQAQVQVDFRCGKRTAFVIAIDESEIATLVPDLLYFRRLSLKYLKKVG